MKKRNYILIIIAMILCTISNVIVISQSFAGDIRTTPQDIVLTQPTTNKVDVLSITFVYSSVGSNHHIIIKYNIVDNDLIIRAQESVKIINSPDDLTTDAALCTGEGEPFDCCTGAGTGDCDESDPAFTNFIQGYGSILDTRVEQAIWEDIQAKFTVVP